MRKLKTPEEIRKECAPLQTPDDSNGDFVNLCIKYAQRDALELKNEYLARIRFALYARDTDDEIIANIDQILTEAGRPYENED